MSKNHNFSRAAYLFASLLVVMMIAITAGCQAQATATTAAVAKPSNPGGPGDAVNLTGDATNGATVFKTNCVACHAADGKGGIPNPGSTDGTVPPLNPIDSTLVSGDAKTNITNIDLFIEHGSTPAGTSPALKMQPFGDQKTLKPQEIADVIAYVLSLNKK
jgi:mono/diheme cytochrome c family protein